MWKWKQEMAYSPLGISGLAQFIGRQSPKNRRLKIIVVYSRSDPDSLHINQGPLPHLADRPPSQHTARFPRSRRMPRLEKRISFVSELPSDLAPVEIDPFSTDISITIIVRDILISICHRKYDVNSKD
jgi:hypothetical protein